MNLFTLFKIFNYKETINNLQSELLELQQAYNNLNIEKENLHNEILNLKTWQESLLCENSTLKTNFDKQEEFINKLKTCSEQLNNLFFEDENRRY
jgi:hypothetical protein